MRSSAPLGSSPLLLFLLRLSLRLRGMRGWALPAFAVALTVLQLFTVMAASQRDTWKEAYFSALQYDSDWYRNIAEQGYHSTVPPAFQDMDRSNVGFFPGYPQLVRVFVKIGISSNIALLTVAQAACIGFWWYFLLYLRRRLRCSPLVTACAVLAMLCYPVSFYFVTGYAESLFLFCLMGFLYWYEEGTNRGYALAIAHGMGLTATRLLGAVFALIPLFSLRITRLPRQWTDWKETLLQWEPFLSVTILSMLGVGFFFVYCQSVFGLWNLYAETQRIGWDTIPHPEVLTHLWVYLPALHAIHPTGVESDTLSAMVASIFPLWFVLLLLCEVDLRLRRAVTGFGKRIGFYVCSALGWMITVESVAHKNMNAMSRHALPLFLLLLLATIGIIRHYNRRQAILAAVLLSPLLVLSLFLELTLVARFTHGGWVA